MVPITLFRWTRAPNSGLHGRPEPLARLRSKALDLNDHVLETGRVLIQDFAFIFADHHRVRMAHATPIGVINAGLATERHPLFKHRLVSFGDPWSLVPLKSDSMSSAVLQKLLEAGLTDLVEALLIDFFRDLSFLQVFDSGVVCRQHGI